MFSEEIYVRNDATSVCPFMEGGQRMVKLWRILLFMFSLLLLLLFHLVLGERYQLGHCPVSCSSCNIDLFYFILFYFIFFI